LRALGLELEAETEGGGPPLSTVEAPDCDGRGGEDRVAKRDSMLPGRDLSAKRTKLSLNSFQNAVVLRQLDA